MTGRSLQIQRHQEDTNIFLVTTETSTTPQFTLHLATTDPSAYSSYQNTRYIYVAEFPGVVLTNNLTNSQLTCMNILPKAETSKKEQRFEYKISSQNGQEVLLTTHDVKVSAGVRGVFTKDDKRYEWKDGSEGDGFYTFTGTSPSSAPCASFEYFGPEGDDIEQFALITLWSILMGDMFNKQGRLKDVFTKRVHKFDLGEVWVPGTGVAFDSNDLARDVKQVQNAFGKMGRGFGKLFGK